MKLKRLTIDRLPGIDQTFEIESAGAGVHIVFGPNAIGKSSICRAVESLYWNDRGPTERVFVTGQFELDGETWRAERDGSRLRWRSGGEDRAGPSIPASRNHRCYFLRLRDLIDPSREGTGDIASEIRRQMSGGFDLDGIVESLFHGVSSRQARRQRDTFNDAAKDVQDAEGRQRDLERRADALEALTKERAAVEAAERRLPFVDRALGLARRVEERAGVRDAIAGLPPALTHLTGQEAENIEQLREQRYKLEQRARALQNERDAARADIREARLPTEVNGSELAAWREHADELVRIELKLQEERTHRGECRKKLESALSALGGGDVDEAALTLDEHGRWFEFLRDADKHRAKTNEIESRLELLANVDRAADAQGRLENLRTAVAALRHWLRAPEPETFHDRLRARRVWIVAAAATALAGAGLAVAVDPRFGLLLAAGVGVMAPVILLRGGNADSSARTYAEKAFAKLGIAAPTAWDAVSVEARLDHLEVEFVSVDSQLIRARDRDVEQQQLQNQLNGLAAAEASLEERRQHLRERLHLDSIVPDAELIDLARALDRLRETRIEYAGAVGRIDELEASQARLLSRLADVLQRHGEPVPEDAPSAKAYLSNLSERNAQWIRARADERRTEAQLQQVSADRDEAGATIGRIYADASLDHGDLAGLTALLKSLPQYHELKQSATRLDHQIALDRDELAKAGEAGLADCGRPALEGIQRGLLASAAKADDLRRRIADTEAEVKAARRGHTLHDLLARRETARAELEDCRDKELLAGAGQFLVDAVESEYEQSQMPRVFERARHHFSAFTHHGYELRLGRDAKSPRLYALDQRNGEDRELDQLSDGTRAHLLLASRIAFAEEIERGTTLPLFLDEALDQSDPARFEAIARSLGRIADDEGRQIFYLTSDPLDRERFRQALVAENCVIAAEIDLGAVRGQAARVTEAATLQVPPRAVIPVSDGTTAEEYGVKLGVPAFTPAFGYARQHFFYVLFDDLDLLRDFLVNGIEQAGQWRTVSNTPLAERLASRSTTPLDIDSRVRLLQVFCEAWNQGRGRAVDRDALVGSRALSERYLDDVAAIAGEMGNDPEKLLAALLERKDPRLRGFRKSSADALDEYLRDNGYLDDRPVLGKTDLRLRALASPPANQLPDGVASDCVSRWWAWAARMSDGGE